MSTNRIPYLGAPSKLDRMRSDARDKLASALGLLAGPNGSSQSAITEAIDQASKARNVLIELEREMIRDGR